MQSLAIKLSLFAFLLALGGSGCEKRGPAERLGERIDEGAEEIEKGVREFRDSEDESR